VSGFPRDDVTPLELVPPRTVWWMRWKEFGGWTDWRECSAVTVSGSWLIVHEPGQRTYVPDHIVRGRVEVVTRNRDDGPPPSE